MIDLNKRRFCEYSDQNNVNILHGLNDLISNFITKNSIVCEIGSFKGVSSELIAKYCHTIYCVDPWIEYNECDELKIKNAEEEFDKVLLDNKNIIKIKKTSIEASNIFNNEFFDLIYIDGSHVYENVKEDIIAWLPKIKKNGIIAGHDYSLRDVKQAIKETIGHEEIKVYSDSSWAKRKII